jgi:hypothetical protein
MIKIMIVEYKEISRSSKWFFHGYVSVTPMDLWFIHTRMSPLSLFYGTPVTRERQPLRAASRFFETIEMVAFLQ